MIIRSLQHTQHLIQHLVGGTALKHATCWQLNQPLSRCSSNVSDAAAVDCVVIGAGVVGLACARAIARSGKEVIIVESESAFGTATSSRNSEVIHAGLYYPQDSLKSKMCVEGKKLLYEYCEAEHVPYKRIGKLIVATSSKQIPALEALKEKGNLNGVDDLKMLSGQEAMEMEPALRCVAALMSPSTGILDTHSFMSSLLADAESHGATLVCRSKLVSGTVPSQVQEQPSSSSASPASPSMGGSKGSTRRSSDVSPSACNSTGSSTGSSTSGFSVGVSGGSPSSPSVGSSTRSTRRSSDDSPSACIGTEGSSTGSSTSGGSVGESGASTGGDCHGNEVALKKLVIQDTASGESTEIEARWVINAAGLGAQDVASKLRGLPPSSIPKLTLAKGNYFSLSSHLGKAPFNHLIYPMPEDGGLGVHLTLDLGGQAKFGPDVEWLGDHESKDGCAHLDYKVDPARAERFYPYIRTYFPSLPDGALQASYSGVRPKLSGPGEAAADFDIQGASKHGVAGLINLFGIESPGVTSSLAIAEHVLKLLESEAAW